MVDDIAQVDQLAAHVRGDVPVEDRAVLQASIQGCLQRGVFFELVLSPRELGAAQERGPTHGVLALRPRVWYQPRATAQAEGDTNLFHAPLPLERGGDVASVV